MPNPNDRTSNAPSPLGDKSQIPPQNVDPSAFAGAIEALGPGILPPKGNFAPGSPEYFQDYVDRRLGNDSGSAQRFIDMGLAQPPGPERDYVNLESLGALEGFNFMPGVDGGMPTLTASPRAGGLGEGGAINTYGLSGTYTQTAPNVFTQPTPVDNRSPYEKRYQDIGGNK